MSRGHDSLNRTEPEHELLHAVEAESNRRGELRATGPLPVSAGPQVSSSQTESDPTSPDSLLARCPRTYWTPDPGSMIFLSARELTQSTEELRSLRSRLYRLRESHPIKSLLITSALQAEGKSYIAGNLAHVLALQPGCRVLLIDADMRNPRLHSMLGASSAPGLSEYLLDEVDEFGIMQKGLAENLFFVPSGRSVPGPTELLASGRMRSLLERVEPLFDWIIVDSPAAIPVSDASLLGGNCDGVLLVVHSGLTPFDVAQKARDRFRENQLVGVVLNAIENGHPARSQHYGS